MLFTIVSTVLFSIDEATACNRLCISTRVASCMRTLVDTRINEISPFFEPLLANKTMLS